MMQFRLILLANLLLTSCRAGMHSRFPQPLATLSLPYLSRAQQQWAQCQEELMARIAPCGHGASWPCPGANVSHGTCSAPGHQSGLDSRNRRKTKKNESLIKKNGMNFQDLISKLSEKVVYTFFEHNTASFCTAGITETS